MKRSKKILSAFLAFVMLFTVVSSVMAASAAQNDKLGYSEDVKKEDVTKLVDVLNETVNDLIPTLLDDQTLNEFLAKNVYTNLALTNLVIYLYRDLLPNVNLGMGSSIKINVKPYGMAGQGITAFAAYAGNTKATWDDVDPDTIIWGFKDGDQTGFLNALASAMRPTVNLASLAKDLFCNKYDANGELMYDKDGNAQAGLYDTTVVPLLQALGCEDMLSPKEFTNKFNSSALQAANKEGGTEAKRALMDEMILSILNPVFRVVNKIVENPLNAVLEKLPHLLYSFEQGRLDGIIGLLGGIEGAADIIALIKNEDGSINHDIVGLINNAINSVTGTLVPGVEFGLPELNLDWDAIMKKYGTVDLPASESINGGKAGTVLMIKEADRADVFMYLFNYVADALAMEGNQRLIRAVLAILEVDDSISELVISLLTMPRMELLSTVSNLLGVPMGPQGGDDGDDDNQGGTNVKPDGDGGNDGDGEAEIPQTGDTVISAVAMVSIIAAGAFVFAKKKKEN